MKRLPLFSALLCLLFAVPLLHAQPSPKHEVRAAWITAVYGLDWPRTKATSAAGIRKQQEELVEILDKLKEANFNTVLFQTRTRGDVLYRSSIEPYNSILTGKVGQDPGYDPLAFAVEECHKRGMECHAWMVTIPLGERKHVASLGKQSVTRRQPDICLRYKNEYFLNPGHPKTKEYLMSLVKEVVERYDVDGVHFDYLRYPERALRFPDNYDYRKYGKGRSLDQWRRDNLTEIVRYIYKGVKQLKPWVKVSTCPVGKYRDTSRYPSKGWNAFHVVYQDVQGWLGEGIQDQIYPMMYFRGNSFYPFALDWQEQSNGRHVVPGLGVYFLHPSEGDWSLDEIKRQINFVRQNHLAGEAHYRVKFVTDNTQNLYDALKTGGKVILIDIPKESSYGLLYNLAKALGTWDHPLLEGVQPKDPYPIELVTKACWRTTAEKVGSMRTAGFSDFEYAQTLTTHPLNSGDYIQKPLPGYDSGDYVAICGYKR